MASDRDNKLKDELRNLLKQNFNAPEPTAEESVDFSVSEETAKLFKAADNNNDGYVQPDLNIDFDSEEKKFLVKGETFIQSMYDFYLDMGLISKPEYLNNKAKLDSLNISNIFNQISTTKIIMKRLLGELTRGNMNPRLVESYCTLNNQLSDMIKAQANYILFLEESYKKAKIEAIEHNNIVSEQLSISSCSDGLSDIKSLPEASKDNLIKKEIESDYYITSDAKALMDEIQTDKDMYYDDAQNGRSDYLISDSEAKNLTNPGNKDVLIDKYNVDKTLLDEDKDTSSFESSIDGMI